MAVRIPVYRQQTATPQGRVAGGSPQAVGGPDVGGMLMDVANVAGGVIRSREDQRKKQESELAAAAATETLARIQSEGAREMLRLERESGEAGVGVVDGINSWVDQQAEQAVAAMPTEEAKRYIRERLTTYKGTLDLRALEFETAARDRWKSDAIDRGMESAAGAAAAFPDMAEQFVAEQAAAYSASGLPAQVVRAKKQALIDSVSVAASLSIIERDPQAFLRDARSRLRLTPDATAEQRVLERDSAVEVLSKIQEDAGTAIPAELAEQAVATVMAGGTVSLDPNEGWMFSTEAVTGRAGNWSVDALSVPKLVELMGRAEAEIARREAASKQTAEYGKVLFAQRLNDIQAQLMGGEPGNIPTMAEMVYYLGPERAQVEMSQLQVMRAMAGDLAAMDGQTNEQLSAIVAAKPTGEENRQFRDMAWRVKAERANAIVKARENDPGGYVLATDEPVRREFDAFMEEQQRVSALGESASQDDMASIMAAQRRYLAASSAAQRRLGIAEPKLPEQYVDAIAGAFSSGLKTNNPRSAAAQLEAAAQMMIDSPDAITQVAEKTGTLGAFAIDGVDGLVIKRLAAGMEIKEAELKELLPADVPWADVERAVTDEFAPLLASLMAQGDNATQSRYARAGQILAAEYVRNGKSAADAARLAYNDLYASKNTIINGARVPLTYNVPAVEAGLQAKLQSLTAADVFVPPEQGLSAEESAERQLRTIRSRGRWVNNQTGDGLILMGAAGPVLNVYGQPITIKLSDAELLGLERPIVSPSGPTNTQGARLFSGGIE